jgi:hypothetical protein
MLIENIMVHIAMYIMYSHGYFIHTFLFSFFYVSRKLGQIHYISHHLQRPIPMWKDLITVPFSPSLTMEIACHNHMRHHQHIDRDTKYQDPDHFFINGSRWALLWKIPILHEYYTYHYIMNSGKTTSKFYWTMILRFLIHTTIFMMIGWWHILANITIRITQIPLWYMFTVYGHADQDTWFDNILESRYYIPIFYWVFGEEMCFAFGYHYEHHRYPTLEAYKLHKQHIILNNKHND